MNPITIIDQVLADWASPRVRRLVHALILLAGIVGTTVLAANGDWKVAALTLLGGLYAAGNHANTPKEH